MEELFIQEKLAADKVVESLEDDVAKRQERVNDDLEDFLDDGNDVFVKANWHIGLGDEKWLASSMRLRIHCGRCSRVGTVVRVVKSLWREGLL